MNLYYSAIAGIITYWGNHFFVAPLLEFSRLRKEIHQKTLEYGNIWVKPSETENDYYLTRIYNAANEYRVLGARLEAFVECLAHEKRYWLAKWWLKKYDFSTASTALFALEADIINPHNAFRENEISRLHGALQLGKVHSAEESENARKNIRIS